MDDVDHSRLVEIHNEMVLLLEEAFSLIPRGGIKDRAKYYWYGNIKMNLVKNHEYLGSSMCTMEETVDSLDPGEDEEEEA